MSTDSMIDEFTLKLLEKTKARKECLSKMNNESASRSRKPLTEECTNIDHIDDDVKKTTQKPDTPAIQGVRSRLKQLAEQKPWEGGGENVIDDLPGLFPRGNRNQNEILTSNTTSVNTGRQFRSSRLANLASTINSWDDDYSYHTVGSANANKSPFKPLKPVDNAEDVSNPVPEKLPKLGASGTSSKSPKISKTGFGTSTNRTNNEAVPAKPQRTFEDESSVLQEREMKEQNEDKPFFQSEENIDLVLDGRGSQVRLRKTPSKEKQSRDDVVSAITVFGFVEEDQQVRQANGVQNEKVKNLLPSTVEGKKDTATPGRREIEAASKNNQRLKTTVPGTKTPVKFDRNSESSDEADSEHDVSSSGINISSMYSKWESRCRQNASGVPRMFTPPKQTQKKPSIKGNANAFEQSKHLFEKASTPAHDQSVTEKPKLRSSAIENEAKVVSKAQAAVEKVPSLKRKNDCTAISSEELNARRQRVNSGDSSSGISTASSLSGSNPCLAQSNPSLTQQDSFTGTGTMTFVTRDPDVLSAETVKEFKDRSRKNPPTSPVKFSHTPSRARLVVEYSPDASPPSKPTTQEKKAKKRKSCEDEEFPEGTSQFAAAMRAFGGAAVQTPKGRPPKCPTSSSKSTLHAKNECSVKNLSPKPFRTTSPAPVREPSPAPLKAPSPGAATRTKAPPQKVSSKTDLSPGMKHRHQHLMESVETWKHTENKAKEERMNEMSTLLSQWEQVSAAAEPPILDTQERERETERHTYAKKDTGNYYRGATPTKIAIPKTDAFKFIPAPAKPPPGPAPTKFVAEQKMAAHPAAATASSLPPPPKIQNAVSPKKLPPSDAKKLSKSSLYPSLESLMSTEEEDMEENFQTKQVIAETDSRKISKSSLYPSLENSMSTDDEGEEPPAEDNESNSSSLDSLVNDLGDSVGAACAELDDMLDEALDSVDELPSPPKPPNSKRTPAPQPPKKDYSSPMPTPSSNDTPLMYSVSFYRNQKKHDVRPPVRVVRRGAEQHRSSSPEAEDIDSNEPTIHEKMKVLEQEINRQQSIIGQASAALNVARSRQEFQGSVEQVEGEKLLLIACQKRTACITELTRLKALVAKHGKAAQQLVSSNKGSVTLKNLRLPLKREFLSSRGGPNDLFVHYFLVLIRNGPQVVNTQMLSTRENVTRDSLCFSNCICLQDLDSHFKIDIDVYGMNTSKERLVTGKKGKKTPKKNKSHSVLQNPALTSPGGPLAVRTSSFTLIGYTSITLQNVHKGKHTLEKVPFLSPLDGVLHVDITCHSVATSTHKKGFLTMFDDVSGFGAWHRRWCVLGESFMSYWKYPDDEKRKPPIGSIDLTLCTTEKAKQVARDICARQHTFMIETVRPRAAGDRNTLISESHDDMTEIRYLLSADSKEERVEWCDQFNETLINLRMWNPDVARVTK